MRYRRRRTRTSSGTLLVTFFLGLGLGFSLCYAMLEVLNREAAVPVEPPIAVSPAPPAHPPAVETAPEFSPAPAANTSVMDSAPGQPVPEPVSERTLPDVPPWTTANLVIALPGLPSEADFDMLRHFAPAGVVLPDDAFDTPGFTAALCARIRESIAPVPIVLARLDAATAALENGASLRELGKGSAEEAGATAELWGRALRAMGIDAVLGPRLGAYQGGPVSPEETFGDEPAAIIGFGAAVSTGLQAGGVAPIAVGYPGEASASLHEDMPTLGDAGNINALVDLMAPFAAAIQEGVPAVLIAHVAVPAIEMGTPPPPASFSRKLVYQLLRERRGYEGAIISDDVCALPSAMRMGPEVAAVAALAAGCDVVILGTKDPQAVARVCSAMDKTVTEGLLTRDGLDENRARFAALAQGLPPLIAPSPEERQEAPQETARPEVPTPVESETAATPEAPPEGMTAVTHEVARGETLSGIAGRYGVTLKDLRAWNDMTTEDVLKFGQALTIYVPENAPQIAPEAVEETPEEATPTPTPEPESEPESEPETVPEPVSHAPEASVGALPPQPPGTGHEAVVFGESDTLAGLAQRFDVTVADIRAWNGLQGRAPAVGEVLHLFPKLERAQSTPEPAEAPVEPEGNYDTHVIAVGDTLHSIALANGTTVQELVRINGLSDPNHIQLGQKVKVPVKE